MATYGAVPTQDPELGDVVYQNEHEEKAEWRKQLGEFLEMDKVHLSIVGLTILDALCVLFQIIYTFLHECQSPTSPPHWYKLTNEAADVISQGVTCIFLMELTLAFIAFGPRYYLPGWPHWKLHVLDVVVVVATFVFDIVLHGKEREVAELLIIFRLWRVVRIVEATVLSVSYANEDEEEQGTLESRALEELKASYAKLEAKLEEETQRRVELENELQRLKQE
ncbi:hypothetical protein BX666DRAFT_1978952 [Dichotomocladium elegans]|nr:hypothetical protein BX666DRAFT_1978952 [Dichotomocladium elegans]